MKTTALVSFIFFVTIKLSAQSTYCKILKDAIEGFSIIHTNDGGFAIVGAASDASLADVFVAKFDDQENLEWSRRYASDDVDVGLSMVEANDGSYMITGYSEGAYTGEYIIVLKLDNLGHFVWGKQIAPPYYGDGISIIATNDGNFAVTGGYGIYYNYPDIILLKLDGDGNTIWSKSIGGGNLSDGCSSIVQTVDNGYAIAGSSSNFGNSNGDFYLAKLDSAGDLVWDASVVRPGSDGATALVQTSDSGLVMAGTVDEPGFSQIMVSKFNMQGSLLWSKVYGGPGPDEAFCLIKTQDEGFMIAGTTDTGFVLNSDMYLLKLAADGALQWTQTINTALSEHGTSVIQNSDGSYIAIGWRDYPFQHGTNVIRLSSNGVCCCCQGPWGSDTVGGISGSGGAVVGEGPLLSDKDFTESNIGTLSDTCLATTVEQYDDEPLNNISVYTSHGFLHILIQSPSDSKLIIEMANVVGQIILKQEKMVDSDKPVELVYDIPDLDSGLYFLIVNNRAFPLLISYY